MASSRATQRHDALVALTEAVRLLNNDSIDAAAASSTPNMAVPSLERASTPMVISAPTTPVLTSERAPSPEISISAPASPTLRPDTSVTASSFPTFETPAVVPPLQHQSGNLIVEKEVSPPTLNWSMWLFDSPDLGSGCIWEMLESVFPFWGWLNQYPVRA
jgi:hypothetical protein